MTTVDATARFFLARRWLLVHPATLLVLVTKTPYKHFQVPNAVQRFCIVHGLRARRKHNKHTSRHSQVRYAAGAGHDAIRTWVMTLVTTLVGSGHDGGKTVVTIPIHDQIATVPDPNHGFFFIKVLRVPFKSTRHS
jgi:hypothetical protein